MGGFFLCDFFIVQAGGVQNNEDRSGIDALAVGITFAVLSDINIYFSCLSIGFVTFILCIAATCIGHKFGTKLGTSAEYLGGAILILLGCKILAEHLQLI